MYNQYTNIEILHKLFWTKSSKSDMYFILITHLHSRAKFSPETPIMYLKFIKFVVVLHIQVVSNMLQFPNNWI